MGWVHGESWDVVGEGETLWVGRPRRGPRVPTPAGKLLPEPL